MALPVWACCSPVDWSGLCLSPVEGQWLINIVPVATLLSQGIVLRDLDSFLKTDVGVQFVAAHVPSVRLDLGMARWVPHGSVCIQTLVNGLRNASGCGHMLVYHVPSKPLITAVPPQVWAAIVQVNQKAH